MILFVQELHFTFASIVIVIDSPKLTVLSFVLLVIVETKMRICACNSFFQVIFRSMAICDALTKHCFFSERVSHSLSYGNAPFFEGI